MNGRWALVTGAASGLGAETARQLAADGLGLILVDCDAGGLAVTAAALPGRVEVIEADLLVTDDLERVAARLADEARPVDVLVSCAGFGLAEPFETSVVDDELAMLTLLTSVPLRLAHAVIPEMIRRRRGWVLLVASAAGLLPTGTYAAAKAHQVMLARSLNARYRELGIHVTALCPGLVRTQFHHRFAVQPPVPSWAWVSASVAVREGLTALRRGRPVVVSDWRYRWLLRLARLGLPDSTIERAAMGRLRAGEVHPPV